MPVSLRKTTAGEMLLTALAEWGITPIRDVMSFAIPVDPATPLGEELNVLHIKVADNAPSVDHSPEAHTGWRVWLCDANGEPQEELYDGTTDVRLVTVDCTAYGPYPALIPSAHWGPYDRLVFGRATAERIVDDLNRYDAGCGLTGRWDGDRLTFAWDERYRQEKGEETITPDAYGRYAIGGLWPWDEWHNELNWLSTAGQVAYIRGVMGHGGPGLEPYPKGLAELYAGGHSEARNLHLVDCSADCAAAATAIAEHLTTPRR